MCDLSGTMYLNIRWLTLPDIYIRSLDPYENFPKNDFIRGMKSVSTAELFVAVRSRRRTGIGRIPSERTFSLRDLLKGERTAGKRESNEFYAVVLPHHAVTWASNTERATSRSRTRRNLRP